MQIKTDSKIDEEFKIRLRLTIEKLRAKERILEKRMAELNQLKLSDEKSQDSALSELINIEDNCERIQGLPSNGGNGERSNKIQSNFWLVLLNFFKNLFSLRVETNKAEQISFDDIIADLDFFEDSGYCHSEYHLNEYYSIWSLDVHSYSLEREIKETRNQIERAGRFLKIKARIITFRRNLRNMIRMIHMLLFKNTDEYHEFNLN